MPELPEVETVARGLRGQLVGRRIVGVRLGKTDFIADPAALEERLPGSRIAAVRRYGKFLILELGASDSATRGCLLVHLGMTGRLAGHDPAEPAAPHTHAFFALDDGRELRYTDIRRFGRIALLPAAALETTLARLGLDPLEATAEEFRARLAGRRAMLKALLLDQRVFRGLGNIYTDESLWRARLHPQRQAARLSRAEVRRLRTAVQRVLRAAIRLRGSSVSDYLDAAGRAGEFQRLHRVYQREGKRCVRCGTKIRRIIVAGRSSFFCPRCQPAPRSRRNTKLAARNLRGPRSEGQFRYSQASEQGIWPRGQASDRYKP